MSRLFTWCAYSFHNSKYVINQCYNDSDGAMPEQQWFQIPYLNGIFTTDGAEFIQTLKDGRNGHFHNESLYTILANFQAIKLTIGSNHVLVFNPTQPNSMIIDPNPTPKVQDNARQIVIRSKLPADHIDMVECEQNYTDLLVECLTKNQFEEEYGTKHAFKDNTHAFVICYGKKKFLVYFGRKIYELLHGYFGYCNGARWKTHYFRFKVESVLTRLFNNNN
jgi:hypothetical protein